MQSRGGTRHASRVEGDCRVTVGMLPEAPGPELDRALRLGREGGCGQRWGLRAEVGAVSRAGAAAPAWAPAISHRSIPLLCKAKWGRIFLTYFN